MSRKVKKAVLKMKDPGSAITHMIAMFFAIFAAAPLLVRAAQHSGGLHLPALSVFIVSMILLYAASTIYHSIDATPHINRLLKKLDHCMIFFLIAGSYTPICLIALPRTTGVLLMSIVWSIALVGSLIKLLWITCPKWFSSLLYIAMGWVCMIAFTQILNSLPTAAFNWLLAGGIIYTIGGIIYALKLPVFNRLHKNFGSHEIFHLFVMAGSLCHFILMYEYVVRMP